MTDTQLPVFRISRVFATDQKTLFSCFTDTDKMAKWLRPPGAVTEFLISDVRPGGFNHVRMTYADGSKHYGKYTFKVVQPYDLLVYINAFSDENANLCKHPMSANWPLELLTTIKFTPVTDTSTRLDLSWEPIDATAEEIEFFKQNMDGCTAGWTGTFDALDGFFQS